VGVSVVGPGVSVIVGAGGFSVLVLVSVLKTGSFCSWFGWLVVGMVIVRGKVIGYVTSTIGISSMISSSSGILSR